MIFSSREEAGQKLGEYLKERDVHAGMVLGLPRGGVVVAAEVARGLQLPLDVIVVRKIGHPRHREFAVGALAEGDVIVLDTRAIEETNVAQHELDAVIAEERELLQDRRLKFERPDSLDFSGRDLLIIDDGLATGATMEAAVLSGKKRHGRTVMVAVPVSSETAFERINRIADRFYALEVDSDFDAVGRYYRQFPQTTDEEVMTLLNDGRRNQPWS